jgi:dihydrofolate reductase
MGDVVVVNNVTLDGVMQGPAREDEDTRDGFTHGGWAIPYEDQVKGEFMAARMGRGAGALLLGRRTYEDFYSVWPKRPEHPISQVLDAAQKYVASRTLTEPLPWVNSTLLQGDAGDAIAPLKTTFEGRLTILGSGELIRSLLARDLIDGFLLSIHPLVLGSGRRLFAEAGMRAQFTLAESVTTTTGVVIASYERGG